MAPMTLAAATCMLTRDSWHLPHRLYSARCKRERRSRQPERVCLLAAAAGHEERDGEQVGKGGKNKDWGGHHSRVPAQIDFGCIQRQREALSMVRR